MENFETNQLVQKAALKGIPITAGFELLPECNFNCQFCYARLSHQERSQQGELLSVEQWLNIASQAKQAGTLFILLTGGEPLLYKDFKELYQGLKQLGFYISLNTNASLITDDIARFLAKDPPYKINVTLYGASQQSYQKVCQSKNGYTLAMNGLHLLLKYHLPVIIHGSFNQDNMEDIDALYHFARKNNIPIETTSYLFPPIKNKKDYQRLNAFDTGQCLARIKNHELSTQDFLQLKKHLENIKKMPQGVDEVSSISSCLAGKGAYWITWRGEMQCCGMLPIWKEYPLIDGFNNAWSAIKKHINETMIPLKCHNCNKKEICISCLASLYREQLYDTTDYLCQVCDSLIENIINHE